MTKQILKKWWLWLTVFLVFVLILGALSSEPEPIVAAQVKEIKPPPTASFPKQKYLEETFVADGKVKTFALQNSYKDVTVSLNGEVQVLGVKQEKNIDVVFLDVTPDAQATSKKIQFAEIPPPQSVVTVTGAVFNTEPLKATNTPIITPKSTATPVPTAQQTESWLLRLAGQMHQNQFMMTTQILFPQFKHMVYFNVRKIILMKAVD